jgi:hypothetical protein
MRLPDKSVGYDEWSACRHVALVLEDCTDLQKFIEAIYINILFRGNQATA